MEIDKRQKLPLHLIAFSGDGSKVATASGSLLQIFQVGSNQQITSEDLQNNGHSDVIRSIHFNSNQNLLVSAGDDKNVKLWDSNSGKCLATKITKKRISNAIFAPKVPFEGQLEGYDRLQDASIVYSDKFGDTYCSTLPDLDDETLIMGHCSPITHMTLTPSRDFLLTCDREEKIRVSHFPAVYDIQSFCLGHSEVVTRVAVLQNASLRIVSGGGDGTVRLWDLMSGRELQSLRPKEGGAVCSLVTFGNWVAVVLESCSEVFLYSFDPTKDQLEEKQRLSVQSPVMCATFVPTTPPQLWLGCREPLVQIFELGDSFIPLTTSSIGAALCKEASVEVSEEELVKIESSLTIQQLQKKRFERKKRGDQN